MLLSILNGSAYCLLVMTKLIYSSSLEKKNFWPMNVDKIRRKRIFEIMDWSFQMPSNLRKFFLLLCILNGSVYCLLLMPNCSKDFLWFTHAAWILKIIMTLIFKVLFRIQVKPDQTKRLLNKPYVNEVILRGQNLSLKCCQSLKLLTYIEKRLALWYSQL